MSAKRKLWLAGIVLAIIGVVVARTIAQTFENPIIQFGIFLLGTALALAGLGFIMAGIRK